ncbi:hypothetical protein [Lysinibacter sp. HNR]|uniref:hypothetical protein n=1 Tax=Lysinibacter sp. HNR TaxID=3031408 RepID=UPI002435E0C0|nr:hypothetical protein [Lysinibacter sp. HNR]WGD37694.1 hypothetical protein FrondiHNR_01920 [Lysinibacter sp. HNR]
MPSFRTTLSIGELHPGKIPSEVLPAAAHAAAQLTTLEASDLRLVKRQPRLVIRFTAEDNEVAHQVADHVVAATNAHAQILNHSLTRLTHGAWKTLLEE